MALLNLVYFVPNSSHCINTHKIHSWYSIYTFSLIHKPSKGELIYSRRYVTPEPILWLQQVVYIGSEAQKALEGAGRQAPFLCAWFKKLYELPWVDLLF